MVPVGKSILFSSRIWYSIPISGSPHGIGRSDPIIKLYGNERSGFRKPVTIADLTTINKFKMHAYLVGKQVAT